MISEGDELPEPAHLVRFVGFAKMFKDEDDRVVGPSAAAFEPREGEDYLSVTWCDFFSGVEDEQVRCAIEMIRGSMKVGSKACFCVASSESIREAVEKFSLKPRFVYYPEEDNPAHSGLHCLDGAEAALLELLATNHWSEFLTRDAADALPLSRCEMSAVHS